MRDEAELLGRLREGDESAFAEMVDSYHTRLVRFAQTFVATSHAAEDVAQDTWVAVIKGLERFEERSSLQTWLFRICANRARTRSGLDHRVLLIGTPEPAMDASHFDANGAWTDPPEPWSDIDDRLTAVSLAPLVLAAIKALPEPQKQVVVLRDVEGLSSKETCDVLSITESNQRVLLHRGRARVRGAIDEAVNGRSR